MKQEIKDKAIAYANKEWKGSDKQYQASVYSFVAGYNLAQEEYAPKGMRWEYPQKPELANNALNRCYPEREGTFGSTWTDGYMQCMRDIEYGTLPLSESPQERGTVEGDASSQHKPQVESVEAGKADKDQRIKELEEQLTLEKGGVESLLRDKKELEAENEILKMENSHSKLVVDEAKREIDRLRGLVEEAYKTLMIWKPNSITAEEDWQKFKANNNL